MSNIALYPAHPSQVWMMKALSDERPSGVDISWFARDKDVSIDLYDSFGIDFELISNAGTGFVSNAFEMLQSVGRFYSISKSHYIDLWLSKYGAVSIAAKIAGAKCISFNDDDSDVVPLVAHTSYPFANRVLCTDWTRMGRYENKAFRYHSFHELFYLHPNRFSLDRSVEPEILDQATPFVVVRLSALTAHHDHGEKGVDDSSLKSLIDFLSLKFRVYISSERPLSNELEQYRLRSKAANIHHILAAADLVIGDSQTMIAEAAVLGTPAIRVSSFKNRLSYLDELERLRLCFSVYPKDMGGLPSLIQTVLSEEKIYQKCHSDFLLDITDPVPFFWENILEELES